MTKFLFSALLAFTAVPAFAEPAQTVSSFVQIGDLDLASEAGQRALDKRVTQAIIEVCGEASPADLAGQNKVRDCRQATRARLGAEIDQRLAKVSSGPILVAAR